MPTPDYDILIAGGGLVGASLACALRGRGLRMAMVEARPPSTAPDPRRLAIAYSSRCILNTLGVWSNVAACPIQTVHVSQQGGFGQVQLRHHEFGVPALGYVVAAHDLEQALQRIPHPDLERLQPATIEHISLHSDAVQVTVQRPDGLQHRITTRLLVAADGGRSSIRQQLNIPVLSHDYEQVAILADVQLPQPHHHTAYERFTTQGVFALLPMLQQQATLVHTVERAQREPLLAMNDDEFAEYVSAAFNGRLTTRLRFSPRLSYPLHLLKAYQHTRPRTVLIGNAAHTLHPVAGQGFNLGLRDVAALAEQIAKAQCTGLDIGSPTVLNRYVKERDWDQLTGIAFTDGLVRLFGLPGLPLRRVRSLGLGVLDVLPPAKRLLARQTMGLHGRQSRLARGLPLPMPAGGTHE